MTAYSAAKSDSDGYVDPRLLVECLSIYWQLNPKGQTRQLVPLILNPEAPVLFQTSFSKACFDLAYTRRRQPGGSILDSSTSGWLRQLFLENREKILNDVSTFKKSTVSSKGPGKNKLVQIQMEEVNERYDVVLNVLKVWSKIPHLAVEAC